jgi:sporulation protein YlmC with PRC-barrel domain
MGADDMRSADELRVVPKSDDATVAPGMLAHLSGLQGFMIADPDPDIRGWKVVLPDGRRVGKVDDVLVDTSDLKVRYLEVKVDHDAIRTDEDTWVLVPVGAARLDEKDDVVVIDRLPKAGLGGAPRKERGRAPTAAHEREVRDYYEPATQAADRRGSGLFDQRRFWGRRRAGREESAYLARSGGAAPEGAEVLVEEVVVDGVVVERRVVGAGERGERSPGREGRDD